MRQTIICLLLLIGASYSLHAQDKIVLRNGRTIEVKVQRSVENRVEYTYPGETSVYERPKSAISYILYQDGRKEICDESLRVTERNANNRATSSTNRTSSAKTNRLSDNDEIFWQDVKTTFLESEVKGMTRLKRISAISSISYKDAIQQLKKKAAAIGGTTILVMDIPEDDSSDDIEVMGLAYRDENMSYIPKSTNERTNVPTESSSNVRRRRIAQQMESYNYGSDMEYEDAPSKPKTTTARPPRNTSTSSRQVEDKEDFPDAVYLMNGRVVRGTIEEFEPDDFVSIRTANGRINEYSMDDVKRISRGSDRVKKAPAKKAPARNTSRYYDDEDDDFYSANRRTSKQSSQSRNKSYDNYDVTGYKGTFDAGYNLPIGGTAEKGSFEFNTSHGYQLNEYLFAGLGVGLHIYNARDSKLRDSIGSTSHYPQYVGNIVGTKKVPTDSVTYMRAVDSSFMTLPIFLDIRGYYPIQNSAFTPFAMLRVGFAFNLSDGFGAMGLYMNPAVGVKYQVSPMIGVNLSLGYSYQSYGGIPKDGGYGYYYIKDASKQKYEAKGAGSFSLKLGVEF